MRILMVIPVLCRGGAETVFVRLCAALSERHEVVVFLLSRDGSDRNLLERLGGVKVVYPALTRGIIYKVMRKLSWLMPNIVSLNVLLDPLRNFGMRYLHWRHHFDVCNPHLVAAERQACLAFARTDIAVVGTDHGDYRWVVAAPPMTGHYNQIFRRSDGLICPSQSNVDVASRFVGQNKRKIVKVYNGFAAPRSGGSRTPELPPGEAVSSSKFVFGMVARGVVEKGWKEAIEAFCKVRRETSRALELILVGEGECLRELRITFRAETAVRFVGHVADPLEYIRLFDVGLLPTYFPGESLPTAIVEYLALSKPVIATDVGGIREMLETETGLAGIVVGRTAGGSASVGELAAAMKRLVEDNSETREFGKRARLAFARFSMSECVKGYEAAFQLAIQSRLSA